MLFLAALAGQAVAGHLSYNHQQLAHGDPAISLGRYLTSSAFGQAVMENWQSEYSWGSYLGNAEFWEATLLNWQSEFLAVGSFSVFAIFLRQRGSPESKPVGEPHDSTGVAG